MNIRPGGAAEPAGDSARPTSPWRAKNPVVSLRHAAEGIAHAFRTQRNMRFHVAAFSAIFLAGLMLRLPRLEMIALIFACALVLMAEMVNTAIEAAVDMITDRYHPGAKFVKDIAAGAVLVAAITAAVVGATIFLGAMQLEVSRERML
ncbi:MAG: diacylglycerol kinase family protein, partial [Armatimonadota bacterium]